MTENPYTEEDLRTEAARQHYALAEDVELARVQEMMEGHEVTPDGGVNWDDFSYETHDRAAGEIHSLIVGAADVSEWAVSLGADKLEPSDSHVTLKVAEGVAARVHFAFGAGVDDEAQAELIEFVGAWLAKAVL